MKRLYHLAAVFFWFTAPIAVFLILRSGMPGSYPFMGLLAWNYRMLYTARNAIVPLLFLAQFLPWAIISVLCFVLNRHPGIRYVLCAIAFADLILAIATPINSLTALWDAAYILAIQLAVRK